MKKLIPEGCNVEHNKRAEDIDEFIVNRKSS